VAPCFWSASACSAQSCRCSDRAHRSLWRADPDRWFRGSADCGEDVGGGIGPDEGFGAPSVLGDVAFDRRLQVDDAGEGAASQPTTDQRREEALGRVEPRGRCRRDVERPAPVAGEPGAPLRVFVRGDVVEDRLDRLVGRDGGLDGVEGPDELTVPVALHAAAEHRARQDVEGCKQRRGAVTGIVVVRAAGWPGASGRSGRVRSSAWIRFSSS